MMPSTASILDDPNFQAELVRAMKVLDLAAQQADDNRAEFQFKRSATGVRMKIIIEEQDDGQK